MRSGARPPVVFLYGRHSVCYGEATEEPDAPWPCAKGEKPIPSYQGYDGPAKALASNGYQVVSISANAVNAFDGGVPDQGAQARAELILDHLALWKKWTTVGGGPFGSKFVGKVDLQRDVRRYSALTFRATPDPSGAPKTDLTVRVVDGHGRAAAVPVSAVSDALLRMPGAHDSGLPKNLLRTVRIPTSSLKGIDLRDVRAIELVTDKAASGSVFVSDLAFSTPGLGRSAPSRLPQVSASTVGKVQEGDSGVKNLDFWVTLSRPSPRPVSVYAESGGDLGTSVGSVVKHLAFRPGQTRQKVTVPVAGNTRDSYDFAFGLVLSVPQDALLGQSFGNAEVIDDDPTPTLTVGAGTAAENAGTLKFPLKLSGPSDKYIWLSGELKDGAAVIRKDYTTMEDDGTQNPPDPTVYGQIEPGRTTADIEVKLVDDKVKEPTETFTANLTVADGVDYKLPANLTGTITDND